MAEITLQEALNVAQTWHYYMGVYTPDVPKINNIDRGFTDNDFTELDARLVEVLREEQPTILGHMLRLCLEMWHTPELLVPRCNNADLGVTGQYRVRHIEAFKPSKSKDHVLVKVHRYDTRKTSDGTEYAMNVITAHTEVERAWLDTHYPKWEERWKMAQALDLGPAALTELLRSPTPSTTTDLPRDIDFE